jgi:hypothetical protein
MLSPTPGTENLRTLKVWSIAAAVTAFSAYALDAMAALSGILVSASGFFSSASQSHALLFLLCSYILWGMGLRVNLKANWALLETTGVSTNILSKAAFEFARRTRKKAWLARMAADTGYIATEIAKEAPYYAGAFGAAAFSSFVSARDALVFLGGANLGAALYELGLAWASRAYLRRRPTPELYASFDRDWNPREYLVDYYSHIEADERQTIAFLSTAMKDVAPNEPILFFGVGPTLHHVFLAAETASEIDLGEYLEPNLEEVARWVAGDAAAHDWRPFVRYTLECEGRQTPTPAEIAGREAVTRRKIRRLLAVDLRYPDPLGDVCAGQYGTVISAYCADSATSDRQEWAAFVHRIVGLARPGGTLLMAALRRSHGYAVGGKVFPSANIDEEDLRAVLERHFAPEHVSVEVCELPDASSKGYSGIILAKAQFRREITRLDNP